MVGLPHIHNKKRTFATYKKRKHQGKRGSQREDITSYNFINKKRALSFQAIQQIKKKTIAICMKYT